MEWDFFICCSWGSFVIFIFFFYVEDIIMKEFVMYVEKVGYILLFVWVISKYCGFGNGYVVKIMLELCF